jgi:hypothetical protein
MLSQDEMLHKASDNDPNLGFDGGVSAITLMMEIIADRLSKADWNPCRARVHSFLAVVLFIWLVLLCFEVSPKLNL